MIFKEKEIVLKIAYVISRLSEPFLVLAIFGAAVIFSDYFNGVNRLGWALGLALALGVLPLATLWLGVKKVKNIDIDFTKKEARTPFILVILFYWVLGLLLTWGVGGPKPVMAVLLVGISINIAVLIINFYWKISNHSLVITAVSFFINEFFGWSYWWLFLLIPLVAWARWVQKKHSWWQLAGGAALGAVAWALLVFVGY